MNTCSFNYFRFQMISRGKSSEEELIIRSLETGLKREKKEGRKLTQDESK